MGKGLVQRQSGSMMSSSRYLEKRAYTVVNCESNYRRMVSFKKETFQEWQLIVLCVIILIENRSGFFMLIKL